MRCTAAVSFAIAGEKVVRPTVETQP